MVFAIENAKNSYTGGAKQKNEEQEEYYAGK